MVELKSKMLIDMVIYVHESIAYRVIAAIIINDVWRIYAKLR